MSIQTAKTMKNISRVAVLLVVGAITGCSSTSSPESLAKSHLDLVQAGKSTEANQQYCNVTASLDLHSLKSYQILSTKPQTVENFKLTELAVKVETEQTLLKNKPLPNGLLAPTTVPIEQVTLQVWNSDDFYSNLVKVTAKLNDLGKKTTALTGTP